MQEAIPMDVEYAQSLAQPRFGGFDVEESKARCRRLRRRILEISQKFAAIHIGGAFSSLEMIDTIYHGFMRRSSPTQFWDTFILSKGHGSMALYTSLEELGIMSRDDLETYCSVNGRLGMHPDRGLPGIEASTGSLGHGLGMGAGMALADKTFGIDRNVYIMMSDGELQEGSVWEIILQAPALGLNSLIAFVDYNNLQSMAFTSESHPNFYPIKEKIEAFGWEVVELDGHDQTTIYNAVMTRTKQAPFFVVGKTVKGKGVSYMENMPIWHYRSPNPEEYQQALQELSDEER